MSLHLAIDPGFASKIPPLREEELKQPGDICYANMEPCIGSEPGGERPVADLQMENIKNESYGKDTGRISGFDNVKTNKKSFLAKLVG